MSDATIGGHTRDSSGAVVVVDKSAAVAPLRWVGGFLRDANGALVIVDKGQGG